MVVAIDIGGTKTLVAMLDAEGNVVSQNKFPTAAGHTEFSTVLIAKLHELIGSEQVTSIVIGAPGSVDPTQKVIISCGNLRWHNFAIGEALAEFKIPILLENDAKLGGLAEATNGAGQNYELVLYVTIGTGIGTAVIDKKALVLPRSEGGQMVLGDDGQRFEDLTAASAIKERYGRYAHEIDDPKTWDEIAKTLAAGIFNLVTTVGPDAVVIGGALGSYFEHYGPALKTSLEALNTGLYPIPPLLAAKNPESAVLYGGYLLAQKSVY